MHKTYGKTTKTVEQRLPYTKGAARTPGSIEHKAIRYRPIPVINITTQIRTGND